MDDGGIHYEHPFTTPPERRTPARRLRGRLVSAVTIWTSGRADERTGLTISSLVVADGDPPVIAGLVSDTTSLWDAIHSTGAFVVHALDASHRVLADVFAGVRPNPGGLFAGIEVEQSEFGPVLPFLTTRAHCRFIGAVPAGYQHLVQGEIALKDIGDLDDPLVYFRGAYRHLERDPE